MAGTFYPGKPKQLSAAVVNYLEQAGTTESLAAGEPAIDTGSSIKAIIVPHAGYRFSAPVAASAYARLLPQRERIRRVVMIGPAHRVRLTGVAVSGADAFRTPLGDVPIDRRFVESLLELPLVRELDRAHQGEHCLEVQLPFLQQVLDDFSIVPMVAGNIAPAAMVEILERVWGGPETLLLVSSDLSHYHDYATASELDQAAAAAIEALDPAALGERQACGRIPIRALLELARRHRLMPHTLDLRNSGDTGGPRDRVVGYGAWVFCEQN